MVEVTLVKPVARPYASKPVNDALGVRLFLIGLALFIVFIMVIIPLANVINGAFLRGWDRYITAVTRPDTFSAVTLTLTVAAITVPMNTLFGIAAAWLVTKFDFRGKALLITLIDLPFSVSPVVAGLIYILIFGAQGYFGRFFIDNGIPVIFALPGIVLATTFVTLPFVARTLIPVMEAQGREYEEAAITLGASGWQTLWHVTLPSVKWGLLFGIILCNARAMGEFGAVSVVSGKIVGKTDTLPIRVEKLYAGFDSQAAFAVASILAVLALVTLILKTIAERRAAVED